MNAAAETSELPARPRFLEPYRRITSSGRLIPEIDGLRFIAIFLVYVYHLAQDVLRHTAPGVDPGLESSLSFSVTQILDVGVPLFFAISGFILSLPFAEAHRNRGQPVSLKKYFLRRVTRLEPPYFLSVVLFFLLKLATDRGTLASLFPNFIASLFYVHNFVFGRPSDINMVAWSLEVEVQFYILAPVLACVFGIQRTSARRVALIALLALAIATSQLVWSHPRLQLSLLGYGQYFLVGFLLTEFYLSTPAKRVRSRIWDIVAVAGWTILLALLVRHAQPAGWLAPGIVFLLCVAAFQGVAVRRFVTNPWIATIGGMCYSIYLLHNYAIAGLGLVTGRLTPAGPFTLRLLIQFVISSPIVLAICALYFRLIERPCMRPDWYRYRRKIYPNDL